jgi:hypothetical protein
MKRLSSQIPNASTPTNVSASTNQSFDNSSTSGTTVSSVSQATRPITPAESVRQQFSERTQSPVFSAQSDDESTTASTATATATSKTSDGRLSTSSAKIRELAKAIKSQQDQSKTKDMKNSERVSHLERQLSRLTDLEQKLDEVQTDFGTRLNLFESRMSETVTAQLAQTNLTMEAMMNANLASIMSAVNRLMPDDRNPSTMVDFTDPSIGDRANLALEDEHNNHDNTQCDSQSSASVSHTSSSRSSMPAISTEPIQPSSPVSSPDHKSPDHKHLKSGQKQKKDSVRRRLGSSLDAALSPTSSPVPNGSFDSLDLALQELANSSKSLPQRLLPS